MSKYASLYERSRVPLYLQLASVMRQRIERGEWAHGAKISTLDELEAEFAVGRVTVRQAIELLRTEGLLDAQQGRGTFVSGTPGAKHWFNLATDFQSLVASLRNNVLKHMVVRDAADRPTLQEGEGKLAAAYAFIRSVQHHDGGPFSVVELHLEHSVFAAHRDVFMKGPALPALVGMDDVTLAHAHLTMTIGVADFDTAVQLDIGLGEPTSDVRMVLVDRAGIAIYVAEIHYRKDAVVICKDLLADVSLGAE